METIDMKREKNLITIGKFSELSGLSPDTLRDYDAKGVFSPVFVDKFTGHRYYSQQQLTTVNFVRALRKCGFSLKEISELNAYRTPHMLLKAFHGKQLELIKQLNSVRESMSLLQIYYENIFNGVEGDETVIGIKRMPETRIRLGGKNNFGVGGSFYDAYMRFLTETPGINRDYPVGGLFSDMDAWLAAPSDPDRFFSVDPFAQTVKPGGEFLVGYSRGYYGDTNGLPQRMKQYAEEHSLTLHGAVYNVFLLDEICVADPDSYLMRASVMVKGRQGKSART